MAESVGFIGLGNMGRGMAERLLAGGYRLKVYNRTAEKAASLVEAGAERVDTPGAVAANGDGVVMTMLADDSALDHVVFAEGGLLERLGPRGVHVSLSTISPRMAARLAESHRQRGTHYLAAPVFGRPDAAAAGKLWVVVSGPEAAKARVRPMIETFSQGIHDFGADIGNANVVKLAGNFMIVAAMEAMAEAMAMAEKNGIERARLIEFFGETLFNTPIYRNYGNAIAAHRYSPAGFALTLGLKDIRLVLEAADAAAAPMPLASLLHDRLLGLLAQGHGALDWSALGLAAAREAGRG